MCRYIQVGYNNTTVCSCVIIFKCKPFADGPTDTQLIPASPLVYDYRGIHTSDILGPIRCSATCIPICKFVWYKDEDIYANANVLYIENIARSDHGLYQCLAFNDVGRWTSDIVSLEFYGK